MAVDQTIRTITLQFLVHDLSDVGNKINLVSKRRIPKGGVGGARLTELSARALDASLLPDELFDDGWVVRRAIRLMRPNRRVRNLHVVLFTLGRVGDRACCEPHVQTEYRPGIVLDALTEIARQNYWQVSAYHDDLTDRVGTDLKIVFTCPRSPIAHMAAPVSPDSVLHVVEGQLEFDTIERDGG